MDIRTETLNRRARIVQARDVLNADIAACDALLASLETAPPPRPYPAPAPGLPVLPPSSPAHGTAQAFAQPGAPVPPLSTRAPRRGRGWLTARVKQVIMEGGEEFSARSVLRDYKARYGWAHQTTEDIFASTVYKAAKSLRCRIVSKGKGTRPTIYARPLPRNPLLE